MSETKGRSQVPARADVAIVGAGFSGMYLIKLFREAGLNAIVLEQADGVGGTWYWNRYPGARCDIESVQYGHAYLPELQQEWDWSERYATQPELLAYANEIADRLDVRRDICFGRKVVSATYDEVAREWTLTCDTGEKMIVEERGDTRSKAGDRVGLTFDPSRLYVFDESDQRLR